MSGKVVDAALRAIRDGGIEPDTRREVEAFSERLDAEYLNLQEKDEPAAKAQALHLFRRARAAAALAYALSTDSEQLHEVLYEAAFAANDQAAALRSIEMVLLQGQTANT